MPLSENFESLAELLDAAPLELEVVRPTFETLSRQIDLELSQGFIPVLLPAAIRIGEDDMLITPLPREAYPYSNPIPDNPAYSNPERVRGLPQDGRSLVYSLGALLYHALTGLPPFTDENANMLLYRHVSDLPPDPRSLNPRLSKKAEDALLKALAKRPEDRFSDPMQLITALGSGPAVPASAPSATPAPQPVKISRQPPAPQVAVNQGNRRPARRWLLGLLVTAIVTGLLVLVGGIFSVISSLMSSPFPTQPGGLPSGPRATANVQVGSTQTAAAELAAHQALYSEVQRDWPFLVRDTFQSRLTMGWKATQNNGHLLKGERHIQGGVYTWDVTSETGGLWWDSPDRKDIPEAFAIAVDARLAPGSTLGGYGILFGEDAAGFYCFEFSGIERGRVYYLEKGTGTTEQMVSFRLPTVVSQADNKHLVLVYQDGHFDFYLDDAFVGDFEAQKPYQGSVGLFVNLSNKNAHSVFEFDNFEIRSHPDSAPPTRTPRPSLTPSETPTQTRQPPTAGPSPTPLEIDPADVGETRELLSLAQSVWQPLHVDTFDDNDAGWPIIRPMQNVVNGTYRWAAVIFEEKVIRSLLPGLVPTVPYYLAVDSRQYGSNWDSGLVFRGQEEGGYLFQIRQDGFFQLVRLERETISEVLIDWSPAPAVLAEEVNQLALVDLGEQVILYVNQQFVGAWSDLELPPGEVGVAISITEQSSVVIRFDDFELRSP